MAALLRRLLFFFGILAVCQGYMTGDIVPVSKRVQLNEERTAWKQLTSRHAPRFGMPLISSVDLVHDPHDSAEYKVQFSFNNDEFLTSWLTVQSGREHYLRLIKFTFTYTGGRIVGMHVHKSYYDEGVVPAKDKTTKLLVSYMWREYVEEDLTLGLDVLFTATFAFGALSLILSLFHFNNKQA